MFGFKKFTTLAIAGALAFGMAACAPGETIDDDGEAPTEVESVDPAEFEGKAINYLYFTDGPDEQATRDIIAALPRFHFLLDIQDEGLWQLYMRPSDGELMRFRTS